MAGLVGVVSGNNAGSVGALLSMMAEAMRHEAWHTVELHQEEGFSFGRVTLGIVNPEAQPIWNEDHSLCVVMEGEVYDYEARKQNLAARGHQFRANSDAEFLLHLYEERGESFAADLNGSFVAAIWDRRARKLVLVTDRLGTHRLYYAQVQGRLLFAANVHALLADPALPRTVDATAIAQFLTLDHMLDDRTWLAHVHLMPPSSVMTFCDGHLSIRPYWTIVYGDPYQLRSEAEYVDAFLGLLRQAASRQAHDNLPSGMLLSGGLDSRVLLGVLRDNPAQGPFHAFTWGIPGCDDTRFAREISKTTRVPHHFFELKPNYLLDHAEQGVSLTDGGNCVHFHALASLEAETQFARVIYKGIMGDAIMGTALNRHFWADYGWETQPLVHYAAHRDRGVLVFTLEEQRALYTDSFQRQVGHTVMETYWHAMRASHSEQLADQRNFFDLRQRGPRMTYNGTQLVRNQAVVRTPYLDNDFVDFTLTLPPGFRFERHITRRALVQAYPALAKIPYTETMLPLRPCARELFIRGQHLTAWWLHQWGLRRSADIPKRPYANYDVWFRTVLREWVEATLLSERALERGYFRPDAIRKLVAEQMAGARHAVRLGALISLELWHRQFLDQSVEPSAVPFRTSRQPQMAPA